MMPTSADAQEAVYHHVLSDSKKPHGKDAAGYYLRGSAVARHPSGQHPRTGHISHFGKGPCCGWWSFCMADPLRGEALLYCCVFFMKHVFLCSCTVSSTWTTDVIDDMFTQQQLVHLCLSKHTCWQWTLLTTAYWSRIYTFRLSESTAERQRCKMSLYRWHIFLANIVS